MCLLNMWRLLLASVIAIDISDSQEWDHVEW